MLENWLVSENTPEMIISEHVLSSNVEEEEMNRLFYYFIFF